MNNDNSHTSHPEAPDLQDRIESLLDGCRPDEIDNARIKQLVHARILRDGLERRTRRRHRLAAWLSAAACVALIVGIGIHFIMPDDIDLSSATVAAPSHAGYRELFVAPGKRAELSLSDGTRLVANSCTRVLYPERFVGSERRIFANGEVYLEVAKDVDRPFIVETNNFNVKVLGTVFNIRNTNDSTAQVVLVEGSVEVTTDRDDRVRLKPDDMVELVNGEVTSLSKVDTGDYTMWVDGLISLHGEPLCHLVRRLSNHYGITIQCDKSLGNVKVYGKLELHDSVDNVLDAIRNIVPMEIEREGSLISMKPRP